jgi:hypothetical protein
LLSPLFPAEQTPRNLFLFLSADFCPTQVLFLGMAQNPSYGAVAHPQAVVLQVLVSALSQLSAGLLGRFRPVLD